MLSYTGLAVLSLGLLSPAFAQDEIIWGATIITNFGDRVPLLSREYSELSSVGAQQMNTIGTDFRTRYIQNEALDDRSANRTLRGISREVLDNLQTSIYTMNDVYIQQSTQAFLTGLYPPLGSLDSNSSSPNSTDSSSADDLDTDTLYNRTVIMGPLHGLQYPQIYTASPLDPSYIYLNASYNCPTFTQSYTAYLSSAAYTSAAASASPFLSTLSSAVSSALPDTALDYANAYALWDYIAFGQLHSPSIAAQVTDGSVSAARALASSLYWSIYGNTTSSTDTSIRTIAGAGLASFATQQAYANIQSNGTSSTLALASTGDEALVSLFALLGLADLFPQFTALPNRASAVAFELYSLASAPLQGESAQYPDPADLKVRFMFRNGTEGTLSSFPILGRVRNEPDPTAQEFVEELSARSGLASGPGTWCEACGSAALWCAAYSGGVYVGDGSGSGSSSGIQASKHKVSPVVGGVIGAMVSLAVAGLCLIAAMLLFGIRFTRSGKGALGGKIGGAHAQPRSTGGKGVGLGRAWFGKGKTHKRQSSGLGGFKGGEKLASDVDLPRGGGGGFGAAVVPVDGGAHRRVESWELREGRARQEELQQSESLKAIEGREHV